MKMYVDKLPKSCAKCQFCDKDNGLCEMLGQYFRDGYDYTDCPLQLLADHEKQVRKQVCDEIRNKLKENGLLYTWKGEPKYKTMEELLDQIEKGE